MVPSPQSSVWIGVVGKKASLERQWVLHAVVASS